MWLPGRIDSTISIYTSVTSGKLTGSASSNFSLNFILDRHGFGTQSYAAATFVCQSFARNLQDDGVIGFVSALSSQDYLSTFTVWRSVILKVDSLSLIPSTHDVSDSCFNVTDFFHLRNIYILDNKTYFLHLFKRIRHCEGFLEVRIQTIFNLFGHTKLDPFLLLVVPGEKLDHRVTL